MSMTQKYPDDMRHTGRTGGLSYLKSSSSVVVHGLLLCKPGPIAFPGGPAGAVSPDFLNNSQNNHKGYTTAIASYLSISPTLPSDHSSALPGPHQQAMLIQDIPVSRFKTAHAVHFMMFLQPSDKAIMIHVRVRRSLTHSPPRYDNSKDRIRHTGYASNGRK